MSMSWHDQSLPRFGTGTIIQCKTKIGTDSLAMVVDFHRIKNPVMMMMMFMCVKALLSYFHID